MTGDEVRQSFLSFFKEKGHKVVPGSSLIPHGDPTLLLTSAGMVQFKPYFLGEETPPCPRLASCQKCFRTTDIEVVGDTTHLTFFEMLGNFSVGDYFKEEAIAWAWEYVTERLCLPKERLWITVYLDDDEAFDIWRRLGIPENKIMRFGEKENFWGPAGDSGPCGPCSEIHYDFGADAGCGKANCDPGCDCGRFSEIWNLVFVQYNQDREGNRAPLKKCHIDTGMGLERVAAIMQDKPSVYETDLFTPLVELVSQLSGKKYGQDCDTDDAIRVVAEHGRGITFLIADGVLPDNEGRGYVLRRLLRRAALFGRRLGLDKPFLTQIAEKTIARMGHIYPEIKDRRSFIIKLIEAEEARFGETLDTGLDVIEGLLEYRKVHRGAIPELIAFLNEYKPSPENAQNVLEQHGFVAGIGDSSISQLVYDSLKEMELQSKPPLGILAEVEQWGNRVSGNEVFKLYDTYGFPIELTCEIARKQGFSVDMDGFEKEMEKQRERAKNSHRFKVKLDTILSIPSEFRGYDDLCCRTRIKNIYADNKDIPTATEGQEAEIYLEETPFYGEKGGQVGDTGSIIGDKGKFEVADTVSPSEKEFVHRGRVIVGSLSVGDEVEAVVDKERRLDIARNHTATHLLQYALRKVLGEHVHQRGSLVAPERLRFDFSHLAAMTQEEIEEVQRIVNHEIRNNLPVSPCQTPYKQAIKEGAIALFDEKYGDEVRVLKIGEPAVSTELCGGTHVSATGEIGFFYILSESSIGGGLRRIEAVTGRGAEQAIKQKLEDLNKEISAKQSELKAESGRARAMERDLAKDRAEALLGQVEVINGVNVLSAAVPSSRPDTLRDMTDIIRDKLKSGIVVLGTVYENKPYFIAAVTPDIVEKKYHAGEMVKKVAAAAGGGGGGKAGLAQGSGRDKGKLEEALSLVKSLV